MLAKSKPIAILFLSLFLLIRFGGDGFWRTLPYEMSYLFELGFVVLVVGVYRKQVSWKWVQKETMKNSIFSFGFGFLVAYSVEPLGLPMPFDFSSKETIFLLLIVAPVLEELVFRMALWELIAKIFTSIKLQICLSGVLFALGHFLAFFHVPEAYQSFVLYQTGYTLLLGFYLAWNRYRAGTVFNPILFHFCFNFGFYFAFSGFPS